MAKPLLINFNSSSVIFELSKLDRTKLYGSRKRLVLDEHGQSCSRAALLDNGAVLIRAGITAQGYFTETGRWIPNKQLVGIDANGKPVELISSTLGTEQILEGPVAPTELLDLEINAVYTLAAEEIPEALQNSLSSGEMYRLPFSYSNGYHLDTAILLGNDDGVFLAVGNPATSEWLSLENTLAIDEDDAPVEEELDFDMF